MTLLMWRIAFGVACAVQLAALYAPRAAGPEAGFPYADKVVHLLIFAAVAYLGPRAGVPAWPLFAVLAANAVISEVIQHVVLPMRSGDAFDTVADLVGVALGAWMVSARRVGRT
ncbi:VanZ family protein [Kribbella deserti]|uniref:VanZ family protein n=1 Tax=Kribbella deserti TaxID=1926257 RepID=A0ABV6QR91_9ACTN